MFFNGVQALLFIGKVGLGLQIGPALNQKRFGASPELKFGLGFKAETKIHPVKSSLCEVFAESEQFNRVKQ